MSLAKNFAAHKFTCENFATPQIHLQKFSQGLPIISQLIFALWNPCKIPTVRRKDKGHLKIPFKDLQSLYLFRTTHPLLQKSHYHLAQQFPHHATPYGHQEEEETFASRPISAMERIRGGHTDSSASREARPNAFAPQAPQALTVPSSEGRVPSNPPQRWYLTRRPPTSPSPEPSIHRIPLKRARTSGPKETSRHAQPNS